MGPPPRTGAAVTPTCIFREEALAEGGGKARSASSSSGSRTMLSTLCVWLCRGSGRGGMCTHSGTVTVPPSRSATITSSSSWVSAWKAALTPMMKGVGVLSTSKSCAGRMGT